MVETSSPGRWGCCRRSGRRQRSEAAPGSRVWEGAVGSWPESSHTASDCERLTGYTEVTKSGLQGLNF